MPASRTGRVSRSPGLCREGPSRAVRAGRGGRRHDQRAPEVDRLGQQAQATAGRERSRLSIARFFLCRSRGVCIEFFWVRGQGGLETVHMGREPFTRDLGRKLTPLILLYPHYNPLNTEVPEAWYGD